MWSLMSLKAGVVTHVPRGGGLRLGGHRASFGGRHLTGSPGSSLWRGPPRPFWKVNQLPREGSSKAATCWGGGDAAFPSETVISRCEILNKTPLSSSPPQKKWLHFVNCKDQQDKRKAAFPGDAEPLDVPQTRVSFLDNFRVKPGSLLLRALRFLTAVKVFIRTFPCRWSV